MVRLGAREKQPGGASDARSTPRDKNQTKAWEPPEDLGGFREIRAIALPADLGRRYGLLVGDVNPIHLSPWTARPFGFKRPIAQGFCLKAMVAHALVRSHGGGDPASLEGLHIRFRKAASLPGRVLCLTREQQFLLTSEDRSLVLADGEFTLTGGP